MSTANTTHHPHLPGPTVGAVLAATGVIGAVTLLGAALSRTGDATPLAPTVECTSVSCVGPDHPVLPGRHDHRELPGGGLHPATGGGRTVVGQP